MHNILKDIDTIDKIVINYSDKNKEEICTLINLLISTLKQKEVEISELKSKIEDLNTFLKEPQFKVGDMVRDENYNFYQIIDFAIYETSYPLYNVKDISNEDIETLSELDIFKVE